MPDPLERTELPIGLTPSMLLVKPASAICLSTSRSARDVPAAG